METPKTCLSTLINMGLGCQVLPIYSVYFNKLPGQWLYKSDAHSLCYVLTGCVFCSALQGDLGNGPLLFLFFLYFKTLDHFCLYFFNKRKYSSVFDHNSLFPPYYGNNNLSLTHHNIAHLTLLSLYRTWSITSDRVLFLNFHDFYSHFCGYSKSTNSQKLLPFYIIYPTQFLRTLKYNYVVHSSNGFIFSTNFT